MLTLFVVLNSNVCPIRGCHSFQFRPKGGRILILAAGAASQDGVNESGTGTLRSCCPGRRRRSGQARAPGVFIPKAEREKHIYGSEFEIQLRNKLTQRAVARECAEWIRKKASFRSNRTKATMQQFACVAGQDASVTYMPVNGFTTLDLGYQKGNAVSNMVNHFDDATHTTAYLELFHQIWADAANVQDVTDTICQHIESVYEENSPERIYFLILYNFFREFLENIDEDVLPNDRTGYLESGVWKKLFNFQRDAATGVNTTMVTG